MRLLVTITHFTNNTMTAGLDLFSTRLVHYCINHGTLEATRA